MKRHRCILQICSSIAIAVAVCVQVAAGSADEEEAPLSALWQEPRDIEGRDLFNGPWGEANAPNPKATYTFVELKQSGVNPGLTAKDPSGRVWDVKQPSEKWDEGPSEVVLSRVLSAVGYHQPPVYYMPAFTLKDANGTRMERGGRFRLDHPSLKEQGEWSWRMNPFAGTMPYQGLLVMMLLFANSDLKTSNNSVFEHEGNGRIEQWFVVRDLGASLGEMGIFGAMRNDPALYEQQPFITGIVDGFVDFDYPRKERMLTEGRITPQEVVWACNLLARLTERQWRDAFRAGGYSPEVAARFIRKIRHNIDQGLQLAS